MASCCSIDVCHILQYFALKISAEAARCTFAITCDSKSGQIFSALSLSHSRITTTKEWFFSVKQRMIQFGAVFVQVIGIPIHTQPMWAWCSYVVMPVTQFNSLARWNDDLHFCNFSLAAPTRVKNRFISPNKIIIIPSTHWAHIYFCCFCLDPTKSPKAHPSRMASLFWLQAIHSYIIIHVSK